jgi:hypothetical protein
MNRYSSDTAFSSWGTGKNYFPRTKYTGKIIKGNFSIVNVFQKKGSKKDCSFP